MQYKEKLQKNGLTEAELTPRIKSMIADLKEALNDKAELEKDLQEENYEDEDEKEEMISGLEEVNELIASQDAELSEKIRVYAKNKKANTNKSGKTTNDESDQNTTSQPKLNLTSGTTKVSSSVQVTKEGNLASSKKAEEGAVTEPDEKKKSNNGILWGLLGIGALVLTFGTVNMFSGDE
jgi:hypothetical protein